jgi:hypothetical protein
MEKDLFIFNVLSDNYSFFDFEEAAPHLEKMGILWLEGQKPTEWSPPSSNESVRLKKHYSGELRLVCNHTVKRPTINLMDFYVGGGANEKLLR